MEVEGFQRRRETASKLQLKKKQNKVFTMYEKEHRFHHSVMHVTRAYLPGEPVRT